MREPFAVSTTRPVILDAFCGAGGAAMGYHRAGFDVVGVDIKPQPRFPFDFVQDDALDFVRRHGREFDAIHASPPCQGYSRMRHLPWLKDKVYPLLIGPTRDALEAIGVPWVIENVEDAPLLNGVNLCGTMFGLKVYRHRKFESNVLLLQPPHVKHRETIGRNGGYLLNDRMQPNENGWVSLPSKERGLGAWHRANDGKERARLRRDDDPVIAAGHFANVPLASAALGIDWMKRDELSQAIPPAYTFFIGGQLMRHLGHEVAHEAA